MAADEVLPSDISRRGHANESVEDFDDLTFVRRSSERLLRGDAARRPVNYPPVTPWKSVRGWAGGIDLRTYLALREQVLTGTPTFDLPNARRWDKRVDLYLRVVGREESLVFVDWNAPPGHNPGAPRSPYRLYTVIPKERRDAVMNRLWHTVEGTPLHARDALYDRLSEYTVGITKADVAEFVKVKHSLRRAQRVDALIQAQTPRDPRVPRGPGEVWSVHAMPLGDDRHVTLVQDKFSRWMWAGTDEDAEKTLRRSIYANGGAPHMVVCTDETNRCIAEECARWDIETGRCCEGNFGGVGPRHCQKVHKTLSEFMEVDDETVQAVVYGYNTTKHRTIGTTPAVAHSGGSTHSRTIPKVPLDLPRPNILGRRLRHVEGGCAGAREDEVNEVVNARGPAYKRARVLPDGTDEESDGEEGWTEAMEGGAPEPGYEGGYADHVPLLNGSDSAEASDSEDASYHSGVPDGDHEWGE